MDLQKVEEERKGEIYKELLVAKILRELRRGRSPEDVQQEVFEMTKEIKAGVEEIASVVSEVYEEALKRYMKEQKEEFAELGNPNAELEGAITPKDEE